MLKKRLITSIGTIIVLALVITIANAQLNTGIKAPDFTLKSLDNKSYKLSDFAPKQSKVVVLDIWATWCPPCKAEIPYLVDMNKRYSTKGVQFIGVAVDAEKSTISAFVKDKKINYLILHDPYSETVGESYKVRSIPATYIIDRKGIIRYVHKGFGGKDDATKMENEIKTLLAEKQK